MRDAIATHSSERKSPRGRTADAFDHDLARSFCTDVDPLGSVYDPAIFRYVTQAEATLFRLLSFPDTDLLAHGDDKPRARVEVRYHCPFLLHDTGTCMLTVQDIQRSSLHFAFTLQRQGDDRPAVTGSILCVFIDVATRRPVPLARTSRQALATHAGTLAEAS